MIRKPPMPESYKAQPERGSCRWCGQPIVRADDRSRLDRRRLWHDGCADQAALLSRPDVQRAAVFARDNGRCAACGAPAKPVVVRRNRGEVITLVDRDGWRADYVEIDIVGEWFMDHRVPLWRVEHLPDRERAKYFQLGNLQTLCRACHADKTRREAAERAKLKRIAARDGMRMRKKSRRQRREECHKNWQRMP